MQPLLQAQSLPLWSLLPPLLQPLQHPKRMVLDLVVSGSSIRPTLNLFLQVTLPSDTLQLQGTYLVIPRGLKLLRRYGGKYLGVLKKDLHIAFGLCVS